MHHGAYGKIFHIYFRIFGSINAIIVPKTLIYKIYTSNIKQIGYLGKDI